MSLDIQKLKDKLEQLKNPGARRSKKPLWRPNKDGEESLVRLIEYPYDDDPFVELWFHYQVGTGPNSNFLCPRLNHGKSCPVCDFASSLIKSEDEQDKALAKKLFAKQRIYAVVIDRGDAEPTPKLWGFGKTVYQQLLTDLVDEDVGNYMDPKAGLDAKVRFEQPPGQQFPKTHVRFARKESPLADSEAEVQQIKNKIPKVEDVYQLLTRSQIDEQLSTWLNSGVDAEEESKETTRGGTDESSNNSKDSEVSTGSSFEDIDAAFEEALG